MLDVNRKSTWSHLLNLSKTGCTRDFTKYFWNGVTNILKLFGQQTLDASSINVFKVKLSRIRDNNWKGFLMSYST